MDDDDKTAAEAALEKAILDYLVEHTESEAMVLEGFIFQAFGRSLENLDNHETSHIWGHMSRQPVHVTIGLATMLKSSIMDWFRSGEPEIDN